MVDEKVERSNTEMFTYGTIGALTLAKLSGFTLGTITPFLPMIGVGTLGLGSLFSIYRILTKDSREQKKMLEDMREGFNLFFEGSGIKNKIGDIPYLIDIKEEEYVTTYSFIKPNGFSTHILDNNDIAIKEYFGKNSIEFESVGDFINIKVTTTELPHWIPFQMPKKKDSSDVVVSLGRDVRGKDVELNLSKCPNVMISGCTGSGKSINTNVMAVQLYSNYPNIEMYLIDMKCVELGIYADLPQTKKYTNKLEGAKEIIRELLEECDRRNELLNKMKVKKLINKNIILK